MKQGRRGPSRSRASSCATCTTQMELPGSSAGGPSRLPTSTSRAPLSQDRALTLLPSLPRHPIHWPHYRNPSRRPHHPDPHPGVKRRKRQVLVMVKSGQCGPSQAKNSERKSSCQKPRKDHLRGVNSPGLLRIGCCLLIHRNRNL